MSLMDEVDPVAEGIAEFRRLCSPPPRRIQRRRTAGWRMPPGAIYVGRPTLWGNPFATAAEYRAWLVDDFAGDPIIWKRTLVDASVAPNVALMGLRETASPLHRRACLNALEYLRGRHLACWCALDAPCHADALLELANAETAP